MSWEIMERGDHTNCGKFKYGERTYREDALKRSILAAKGVERLVGQHTWLGTLEGAARSVASTEVVVSGDRASHRAYIVLYVPAGSDIDVPVGSLTAIRMVRLNPPSGVSLPEGADLWQFSGDLIASVYCGRPTAS